MRVRLLTFGVLKELLGGADGPVDLLEDATVGGLLDVLRARTSNTGVDEQVWRSLAVAVNRSYAAASHRLREGDEVALLPPVSGGALAGGERLVACADAFRCGSVRDAY